MDQADDEGSSRRDAAQTATKVAWRRRWCRRRGPFTAVRDDHRGRVMCFCVACTDPVLIDDPASEEAMTMSEKQAALAAEAFIYGFPLISDTSEVSRFVKNRMGSVPPTAWNEFGHATGLAGPKDTFVSINNHTVSSIAQVDVSGGPVRLDARIPIRSSLRTPNPVIVTVHNNIAVFRSRRLAASVTRSGTDRQARSSNGSQTPRHADRHSATVPNHDNQPFPNKVRCRSLPTSPPSGPISAQT
jgi:hypothetical protein